MRTPWLLVGTLIGVVGFMLTRPALLLPTPAVAVASFWLAAGLGIGLFLDRTKQRSRISLRAIRSRLGATLNHHLSAGETILTVVVLLVLLFWLLAPGIQ